jgi:preprotein translocase subunit SecE
VQGVQRYVVFSFLVGAGLLWVTLSRLFQALAFALNAPDVELLGSQFTLSKAVSMGLSVFIAYAAFKNERVNQFSSEVVAELRKVTWPGKEETKHQTVVVIITTLVIALLLGLFDAVWGWATGHIYPSV